MTKLFRPIDCGNSISVYEDEEGNFGVSENQVWLPGIYDSKETAIKAVSMNCDKLEALWESKKTAGSHLITLRDLV